MNTLNEVYKIFTKKIQNDGKRISDVLILKEYYLVEQLKRKSNKRNVWT